jgi:hypothetical protein
MKKSIFIIGLLLLLVSCNPQVDPCQSQNSTSTTATKEDETLLVSEGCVPDSGTPSEPTGEVPHEALIFEADVTLTKFDANDEIKVRKAISLIKTVIASQEFKDRVINFTYGGTKKYVDNGGLSNEQIYQKLVDGSEDLRPGIDHQMDLDLELYYSSRSTVGYTYPSGLRIWMNTKFFDKYTPSEVAGNVFHEWTHKLGFGHASSYSVSRDSSVPYAIGYLMKELGKKFE